MTKHIRRIQFYCRKAAAYATDRRPEESATTWRVGDSVDRGVILIGPDTGLGSVVRDESGQIVGVRRFQVL